MTSTLTATPPSCSNRRTDEDYFELRLATPEDRRTIYRMRHEVYAEEIGQHGVNEEGLPTDALDGANIYLVAACGDEIGGFVSVTPPAVGSYSIDKYFARGDLPFPVGVGLFEVRLLTVGKAYRGSRVATLLMVAAFRWVEAHGGSRIVAIGRREVLSLYLRGGLLDCGLEVKSGAVHYRLLSATIDQLRTTLEMDPRPLGVAEKRTRWSLSIPLCRPATCFHGGAFFEGIGPRFDQLNKVAAVINADVLDAWFPPAPAVQATIHEHLPWLLRTSPPTGCEGLIETIAQARGLLPGNVLVGAGSSDLIFRALPRWLNASSRVLLLDPTYGEYAHVLEEVIGCRVERLPLRRESGYEIPLEALRLALSQPYDLVVLVNPNSPTGRHLPAEILRTVIAAAHPRTRFWVDETYVDFVGPGQTLETFAAQSENVIVCKSMSKAYALSGARVAYLCAGAHQLEELRAFTPPWVVSLVAQVAAVRALESTEYYSSRWRETALLRDELALGLVGLGWEVIPGTANFLLCHLPKDGPLAADVVSLCRERGLFLRDAKKMGTRMGERAIRVAVKDAGTNRRITTLLGELIHASADGREITSHTHR